jgi:hypothetical protein
MPENNAFDSQTKLDTNSGEVTIYSLKKLDEQVSGDVFSLPFSSSLFSETAAQSSLEMRTWRLWPPGQSRLARS